MTDEQRQVEYIHMTQHIVLTVERWPIRTAFNPDWLETPHVRQATVDHEAQTVTFDIESGKAVYRLRRDLPVWGPDGIVADLIEERGPRGGLRRSADPPAPEPDA